MNDENIIQVGHYAKIGDSAYEVLFVSNPKRVIVNFEGALTCLDLTSEGWQLSGTPSSDIERQFIESQPGWGTTTVTITKD